MVEEEFAKVPGDSVLIEGTTPLGYRAILRSNNWERHKTKHPEIADYLPEVSVLLSDPHLVIESGDGTHHYYRFGLGRDKYSQCYIYSVVRKFETDEDDSRTVTTVYFTHAQKNGVVRWQRTP